MLIYLLVLLLQCLPVASKMAKPGGCSVPRGGLHSLTAANLARTPSWFYRTSSIFHRGPHVSASVFHLVTSSQQHVILSVVAKQQPQWPLAAARTLITTVTSHPTLCVFAGGGYDMQIKLLTIGNSGASCRNRCMSCRASCLGSALRKPLATASSW